MYIQDAFRLERRGVNVTRLRNSFSSAINIIDEEVDPDAYARTGQQAGHSFSNLLSCQPFHRGPASVPRPGLRCGLAMAPFCQVTRASILLTSQVFVW